jgi:tRNA-specific 2-thiouridylase
LFPIGHLKKSEVRDLAKKFKLHTAERKDSQGICFLGKFKFSDFLEANLGKNEGNLVEIETDKIIGKHDGFWFYTIGQRQGLGLSEGPWYVAKKDVEKNIVFISKNYNEIADFKNGMLVKNFNWIIKKPENKNEFDVRFRHGKEVHSAIIEILENNIIKINLKKQSKQGIASGQFAVLYNNEICLGGGIIDQAF